jgi:hypothetical protein
MASTFKDNNVGINYNCVNTNNFLNTEKSEIAEFYNGRSVFITGGTGFMGKVRLFFLIYVILCQFDPTMSPWVIDFADFFVA